MIAWGFGQALPDIVLAGAFLFVGLIAFVGDFAISLERVFSTEIQQKTLSSLLLLPRSRDSLCRRLTLGVLPGVFASMSCVVCGATIALAVEPRAYEFAAFAVLSPWFYECIALLVTTLYVGLFLSVRLRQAGMLVAIISLWFVLPIVINCTWVLLTFFLSKRSLTDFMEHGFPIVLIALQIPLCWWMHKLLIHNLDEAGAVD